MWFRGTVLLVLLLTTFGIHLSAQTLDSTYVLSGIVYDEFYRPVAASHVINMNTHIGDVTDSLGIFRIPVHSADTLLIRNIAFRDTLVPVTLIGEGRIIRITRRFYPLQEARIFEWGSTYADFHNAIISMPNQQTFGESMGLPTQDPDYVPLEMDEEAFKKPMLLFTSPVSYFYYNFSRHARSARKVYWFRKNRGKQTRLDEILGEESLVSITGLKGDDLLKFRAYLYQKMKCGVKCSELQVFEEIYSLWEVYKQLERPLAEPVE